MELIVLGVLLGALLAAGVSIFRRRGHFWLGSPRRRRQSGEPPVVDLTSMPSHLRDPASGRVDRGWL